MKANRQLWEIVTTLLCIADGISARVDAELSQTTVSLTDVKLMIVVEAHSGLSQTELSSLVGLSQAVVSTRLDRMEQAGWVRRTDVGRRRVSIEVTSAGMSVLGKSIEAICERGPLGTVLSASAKERRQVLEALRLLSAHLDTSQAARTAGCVIRDLAALADKVRELEETRTRLERALVHSNGVVTKEVKLLADRLDRLISGYKRAHSRQSI